MVRDKTTLFGIVTIIAAVSSALVAILDGNPATNPDWPQLLALFGLGSAGVTGIFARTNSVSDEQAGAGVKK